MLLHALPSESSPPARQSSAAPCTGPWPPEGRQHGCGFPQTPDPPCIPKPTTRLLSQTQHSVLKAQRKGLGDKIPSSSFRWPCHQGRVQTSYVEKVPFLGLPSSCGGWRRLYISGKQSNTTSLWPPPVLSCALTDSLCPCSPLSRVDQPPN